MLAAAAAAMLMHAAACDAPQFLHVALCTLRAARCVLHVEWLCCTLRVAHLHAAAAVRMR
jgi:hypothetical protein